MAHFEHEKLGVSFDLPEIRQRDAEALLGAGRSIRWKREVGRQEVIDETADDIQAAIMIARRDKLRPSSMELAALVKRAAEGVVSRMSEMPLTSMSEQETAGIWCRAMARLGWLGEIDEEGVGDLSPAAARWIALQAMNAVAEASTVPNA